MNNERMRIKNVPHPNRPSLILASSNPSPPPKKLHSLTPSLIMVIYPKSRLSQTPEKIERIEKEKMRRSSRLKTILNPMMNNNGGRKKAEMPNHL